MRPTALVLYLSMALASTVPFAARLEVVATEIGPGLSHWPSGASILAVAESWVLVILVIAFGVLLGERCRSKQRASEDGETRVSVKTPEGAKVRATIRVTSADG